MIKKYNILIRNSEEIVFEYPYVITSEKYIWEIETIFKNTKSQLIDDDRDISNESILNKMIEDKDIETWKEFDFDWDLIITN